MSDIEVEGLEHGIYKVFWKPEAGGRVSLAAVGSMYDGRRWMAPTNWTSGNNMNAVSGYGQDVWADVERVEIVLSSKSVRP